MPFGSTPCASKKAATCSLVIISPISRRLACPAVSRARPWKCCIRCSESILTASRGRQRRRAAISKQTSRGKSKPSSTSRPCFQRMPENVPRPSAAALACSVSCTAEGLAQPGHECLGNQLLARHGSCSVGSQILIFVEPAIASFLQFRVVVHAPSEAHTQSSLSCASRLDRGGGMPSQAAFGTSSSRRALGIEIEAPLSPSGFSAECAFIRLH
jgi:hypothetical protein